MNFFEGPLGPDHVLNLLRARTFSGLRRKMALNNIRLKAFIQYDIEKPNPREKDWTATYYEPLNPSLDGLDDDTVRDSDS